MQAMKREIGKISVAERQRLHQLQQTNAFFSEVCTRLDAMITEGTFIIEDTPAQPQKATAQPATQTAPKKIKRKKGTSQDDDDEEDDAPKKIKKRRRKPTKTQDETEPPHKRQKRQEAPKKLPYILLKCFCGQFETYNLEEFSAHQKMHSQNPIVKQAMIARLFQYYKVQFQPTQATPQLTSQNVLNLMAKEEQGYICRICKAKGNYCETYNHILSHYNRKQ